MGDVNKQALIEAVLSQAGVSRAEARACVDAVFDTISVELAAHRSVQVVGFGRFEARRRAARPARNPRTGEVVQVAETVTPVFIAGKPLKDRVKRKET